MKRINQNLLKQTPLSNLMSLAIFSHLISCLYLEHLYLPACLNAWIQQEETTEDLLHRPIR